jgi:hypothetical protein
MLAPVLGKKKPQPKQKPAQRKNNYGGDASRTRTSPPTSPTDILEDFLGFKIPRTEDEFPQSEENKSAENYNLQTVDYDTDLKVNYKDLEVENKMPDVDYDKLPFLKSIPQEDILTNEKILGVSSLSNEKIRFIKNKLKTKSELRYIILISEILNKPKALRR